MRWPMLLQRHLGPQLGIKAKSNKKSTLAVGYLSMVVIVCGNAPMKTQSLRSYATPIKLKLKIARLIGMPMVKVSA